MATGRLFVGTSGFAYKEWIGPFYPPGTKSAAMLGYYAGTFNSVEVNYTFRRSPTASMMDGWSKATDERFVFALKANQGITHFARLKNTGERLGTFLEAVAPLGPRLGPVLFQCPPNMKYDPEVLDGFLADLAALNPNHLAGEHRFVMEFRHPSFDSDEVREKLGAAGVALCVSDTEEHPGRFSHTGRFAYVRLRGTGYDEKTLEGWGASFRSALAEGTDVYCYLKHEESASGPSDAAILKRMAEA
ncbi:MAG TPA: DUF72 domain-containing protein [Acidimicrobiia bacterium]|jgi:uncharacterized protein YecE (DUF72 family)|nr:DUF72 domain-containing protein [Acidimicrobiia bacterium]